MVTISYPAASFCPGQTEPQSVTVTGTAVITNGYAASPAGLTIDGSTGQITPSTSTPGTYTVKYTYTTALCPNTATTTVTILAQPAITTQPVAPADVCENNGVRTISVSATGAGLTYQWRKNGNPISDDATYTGTNSATLTITNPALSENGATFDVVVSGTCSPSVTSEPGRSPDCSCSTSNNG